jgi:hypothetical protein
VGLIPGRGKRFLFFSVTSKPVLGPTQLLIKWLPGAVFPGVKRPGREANHSAPYNAGVKNCGSMSPLPICLHGAVLN